VSPDGNNVYVAALNSDAVAVFSRDGTTGVLTQLSGLDGCISETGTGGNCADGNALDGVRDVKVSPDGINVYVGSFISSSVSVFMRKE
jgi:DNA-binding beta-propeller fold protein YncE